MKKKLLKSILSLILISSTVLTLFSCNNEAKETEEATDTESITESITKSYTKKETINFNDYDNKKDYDIIRVEDGYRLVFHDSLVYEEYGDYEGTIPYVHFESLQ